MSAGTTKREQTQQPIQPPEIDRGIVVDWPRLAGVLMLVAVPVLAATGLFGETWATTEAESERFRVQVEYPTRMRWRLARPLTVRVENRSAAMIDTVRVEFDTSYVERFTGVNFHPAPDESYVVALMSLRPGEDRHIYMEFQSEVAGRHRGSIVARTNGDSATARVSTVVFP